MSTSNNRGLVVRLSRLKTQLTIRGVLAFVVMVLLVFAFITWKGWFSIPLPEDAGPTELSAYDRTTLIEEVDFSCFAAVTSVFPVTAYNPGWKWGPIGGGQAWVAFDVVGDLDVCIWATDYTLKPDLSGKNLVVEVDRIDINRPRIDLNPREINGVVYQTLKLASISEDKLANANIDRVFWEAARNMVRGDDSTYIDEQQDMLLVFAANTLIETTCFPQALEVLKDRVYQHYLSDALVFGFEDVIVNLPSMVAIPVVPEAFDPGQTELKVIGDETCHVNEPSA